MARLLLILALALAAPAGATELPAGGAAAAPWALEADDECAAASGPQCALNALQRRGSQKTVAVKQHLVEADAANPDGAPQWAGGCENCMQENFAPMAEEDLGASPIGHYALNCWSACGGAGPCAWCGAGNACCRYRYATDPAACHGVRMWPVLSFHTCVQMASAPAPSLPAPAPSPSPSPSNTFTPAPSSGTYQPQLHALAMPSDASPLTFYMYRAVGGSDFPPENVNTANLAGVMWYLHNEVVQNCPRKFNMERLLRFKVTMRATPELYGQNSRKFDSFVAMDQAKCTVPKCTELHWDPYGYVVGCQPNNVVTVAVPGAPVWYSLPGTCPSKFYYEKTAACNAEQPGGACPTSDVTGTRNCTYFLERAGEIRLDELSGIQNYNEVCEQTGQREYDVFTDRGHGSDFWDGKQDAKAGEQRMKRINDLFLEKFPQQEYSLDDPLCE
mmetsp:Transcript_63254/g.196247  ORF Transcript_63254/g.196247 Transcript_63254/m.196247 type:complete len:446 (-) Transcript_63254:216-1553(-)